MSSSYKFRNQEKLYFATFTTIRWVDVFTRTIYKEILLDSFRYCMKHKGLEVYAWVIMSNHVHLIMGSQSKPMADILRDFKTHTAKTIIKAIEDNSQESRKDWMLWMFSKEGKFNPNNTHHQFWQQGNHPIELADNVMIDQKLDYIHNNPVSAGWVDMPEHYLYSSARDYAGIKGLLDIQLIM
ncbi:REP element-mobilizing transposase RayT [Mucilaginibacter pineti]|uniref:REP element-mobilizing transposase RayT n=1 Tax=Mucilaginibacter pineti TaxID=1391627 RepID=A0A1G7KWB4_9SPHI|nr:transposase [Mucilaginibacter pineti]SDF41552.1 REP element-mobilizing transposase RayT [Mucilaginibacter pineti]